jgi:hypothetical protein
MHHRARPAATPARRRLACAQAGRALSSAVPALVHSAAATIGGQVMPIVA